MAGITDQPFRELCCRLGAGLAVSEMVSSNPKVWHTEKSKLRMLHSDDAGIRSVQIAGSCPDELAFAAKINADNGAQIIDINMGCPAKKVNKKLAGSALLRDPAQVEQIVKAVVNSVSIPVTLKIRTGWCENSRNGIEIAKIAEENGIASLAVHGRTRNDFYKGYAEYDTIKAIKQAVSIPVVANGDITSAEKAEQVLSYTGADAIMIGRGAQGRPWIFREINHFLKTGTQMSAPSVNEVRSILLGHVKELHQLW
jgi:tRNA-dihydrouridine synthase B